MHIRWHSHCWPLPLERRRGERRKEKGERKEMLGRKAQIGSRITGA